MWDKNAGTTSYVYNAFGELKKQTDAKGNVHQMEYDELGRITCRDCDAESEGRTDYSYVATGNNGVNQIETISGFNGIEQAFEYYPTGRVKKITETINSSDYPTEYDYDDYGNVTDVTYPDGFGIKKFYDNGYLTDIKNSAETVTIFTNPGYNGFGQCKGYTLGNGLSSITNYNFGFPVRFNTYGIQDLNLDYNYLNGNVTERRDDEAGLTENFSYDDLYRLTGYAVTQNQIGIISGTVNYADNGNILFKTDAGNYKYHASKINAVREVDNSPENIPSFTQNITYTHFHQPATIEEGINRITYTYGPEYQRKFMEQKKKINNVWTTQRTRVYHGEYEFDDDVANSTQRGIHYITSPAGLVCIVVKEGTNQEEYHYTYTDHLGSILTVTDSSGTIEAEQSFDAWGRNRNPDTWTYDMTNVAPNPAWLYRGFTGHEHLPEFKLINMNGRLYDPLLGRMLSVDNYVEEPFSSQGFNRYSYVFNNPLKYIAVYNEYIHNYKTYTTTSGLVRKIYRANGEIRSERAAMFARASKFVKWGNLATATITTGMAYYSVITEYNSGGFEKINGWDAADAVVGTLGVTSSAILMFGLASNPVGWTIIGAGALFYGGFRLGMEISKEINGP